MAAPMPRVPPVTTATRAMPSSLCRNKQTRTLDGQCLSVRAVPKLVLSLDAHCDAHAAANAQRAEALLDVALAHLVQQRHQHGGAGGADRMAERDRPAVDVDLGGIPAEVLVDRAGLRGESLVGLDQFEVLDLPAGFLEC